MPHAIKLHKKYGPKGLGVILVHVQDHPIDLAAFMMKRFPSNTAMVTADNPVPIGANATLKLPMAALIGVEGKVLAVGHRSEVGASIDKLILDELKKMQKGWGATKELRKARALLHGKGKFDQAKEILDQIQPSDDKIKDDRKLAHEELSRRFKNEIQSITFLMKSGSWIVAQKQLKALSKHTTKTKEWRKVCQEYQAKFDNYIGKGELKLDKAITKIIDASRKGVQDDMASKMRKVLVNKDGFKTYIRGRWYASVWDRVK